MNKFKELIFANILAIAGWVSFLFWLVSYAMFSSLTYEEFKKFDPSGIMDLVIAEVILKNILILFVIFLFLLIEILIRKFFLKNLKFKKISIHPIILTIYTTLFYIGIFLGVAPLMFTLKLMMKL